MACLFDENTDDAVMTYDAFIYTLLRTAADEDGSFREAFHADPEACLAQANHRINLSNLPGDKELKLPSMEDAQTILKDYLTDYDGQRLALVKVVYNIAQPFPGGSEQS